jgi:DNA-binding beta-propeller fold protein YncE
MVSFFNRISASASACRARAASQTLIIVPTTRLIATIATVTNATLLQRPNSPGGIVTVFASGGLLNGQKGLAFDSAGNLYAANQNNNTIVMFTPAGTGSLFASDPGDLSVLYSPIGLAFDGAGNLYVANSGSNTIEKFTSGGVGSVFASSGLNSPTFLAVTNDAPEPATLVVWTGLGLVSVGFVALRKKFCRA